MKGTSQEQINLINMVYEFLRTTPQLEDYSAVELIAEFCDRRDLDVVEVGEAIARDKYLKEFIGRNCVRNKILKPKEKTKG